MKSTESKTEKSRRSTVLISKAIEMLKENRKGQREARAKASNGWQDRDYVFCTPIEMHPYARTQQTHATQKVAGKAWFTQYTPS